jgi:peptide/nickel transport system permease protein
MKIMEWHFLKRIKDPGYMQKTGTFRYVIYLYIFIGIFNSFIANEKPLICKKSGVTSFPAAIDFIEDLGIGTNAKKIKSISYADCEWSVMPPIPYSPSKMELRDSKYQAPLTKDPEKNLFYTHWLGTDKLGRDVTAGLVRGAYVSLKVGVFAALLCFFLGSFIGIASAYYGNTKWNLNLLQMLTLCILSYLFSYYFFTEIMHFGFIISILAIAMCCFALFKIIKFLNFFKLMSLHIPLDNIVMRLMEFRKSIPTIFVLLACLPLFKQPSYLNIVILLALLGWTQFARYARAETLKVKELNYVKSAEALGIPEFKIVTNYIFANIMPTLLTVFIISLSGFITIESTLSFLEIGMPTGEVSWGQMMTSARKNTSAWWLAVFPGLVIFIVLYSLNRMVQNIK